jgi:hypothetical protein
VAGSRIAALRMAIAALTGDHRPVLPAALVDLDNAEQTVFNISSSPFSLDWSRSGRAQAGRSRT